VFNLYLESEAANPQLRNPVALPLYFSNFTFRQFLEPRETEGDDMIAGENHFQASFIGTLQQTPPLIGKEDITLTMIMAVQEITDDTYIEEFKKKFSKATV
jgi:hypothetical protein